MRPAARRRPLGAALAPVLALLLAHAGLLATFDLAARPVVALVWLAAAGAALAWAGRRSSELSWQAILLVAAGLRLLLLPLTPTLSDDLYRYLWDGRVVGAGHNPYLLAPDAPELEPLRDALWERLPHRQVATVYPPLAMGLFSIAARLPAPVFTLKTLLSVADLASCWLLLVLARRLGVAAGRAVWYAWNPLVTLEVAGMGHVDALGVPAMLGAVALLLAAPGRRCEQRAMAGGAGAGRAIAAGAAAAAGVLVKLVPAVALPAWARLGRRPWRFLLVAGLVTAAGVLPIAASAGGLPPGLLAYGVSWEFNGPLYEPLWRLLDRLGTTPALHAGLDALKERTGEHDFWNRFYPFNYPQLHAKLLLALVLAVALVVAWRERRPVAATGRALGAAVLCSATVYPWYLLWLLPWAALGGHGAWRLLSLTILLTYLPQTTAVPLFPWLFALIWVPFWLLLVRSRWSTA